MKTCIHCGLPFSGNRCLPCRRKKYQENKDVLRAKAVEYYWENREARIKYARTYFATERGKEVDRAHREANREKRNEYQRQYRSRNTEKWSNYNRARYILTSSEKLSKGLKDTLLQSQNNKCNACGVSFDVAKPHLDHIMPLALGGKHIDANIQLLCQKCNQKKSAKHPDKWKEELTANLNTSA